MCISMGHMLQFPQKVVFISLKIDCVLENSADPDALCSISSGSSLFVKVPVWGLLVHKVLRI